MPLTNEQINMPKKTQEELLDERYGKGYSFGKKMQSGIPMPKPDEKYSEEQFLKDYPNLFIDEKGHVKRKNNS